MVTVCGGAATTRSPRPRMEMLVPQCPRLRRLSGRAAALTLPCSLGLAQLPRPCSSPGDSSPAWRAPAPCPWPRTPQRAFASKAGPWVLLVADGGGLVQVCQVRDLVKQEGGHVGAGDGQPDDAVSVVAGLDLAGCLLVVELGHADERPVQAGSSHDLGRASDLLVGRRGGGLDELDKSLELGVGQVLRGRDTAGGDGHEPPDTALVHRRDDAAGTVADRADPFDYGVGAMDRGEDGFVVVELPGEDRQVRVADMKPLGVAGVGGDCVAVVEGLAYQQVPHPASCPEHCDPQGALPSAPARHTTKRTLPVKNL
jgi:hypothetical protein